MNRRIPERQAMRFRPAEIDEDPQKTQARYGAIEDAPAPHPAADGAEAEATLDFRHAPTVSAGANEAAQDLPRGGDAYRGGAYAEPVYDGRYSVRGAQAAGGYYAAPEFRRSWASRVEPEESSRSAPDAYDPDDPYGGDPLGDELYYGDDLPFTDHFNEPDDAVRPVAQSRPAAGVARNAYRAAPGNAQVGYGSRVPSGGAYVAGRSAYTGGTAQGGAQNTYHAAHGATASGEALKTGRSSIRTAAIMAELAYRALDDDSGSTKPGRTVVRTAGRIRTARRGAAIVKRGARATGRAARYIGTSVGSAVKKAAETEIVKAAAVKAVLPLLVAMCAVFLFVAAFMALFTLKSDASELNETYLYITELDADMEQSLYQEGESEDVSEVIYTVNSYETELRNIQIRTDADSLILYLDAAYETVGLSEQISGFFGGRTVKEELEIIHGMLYSYDTETESNSDEADSDGEADGEAEDETVILYVSVYIRSLTALLQSSGAVDDDTEELMSGAKQLGVYTALTALASPFEGRYYISDRWGWYLKSDGELDRHMGVELTPVGSGTVDVLSCASGTVTEAGSGAVTVSTAAGDEIIYSGLLSVSVSVGQTVAAGARLGTIQAARGLCLEYRQNGEAVNPVFYLPQLAASASDDIVAVALSQLGNVGGETYWQWYGFSYHVPWCACFVSWCAEQCGYIDDGIIPKFSGCIAGASWFRSRGLWQDRTYTPSPGDIIFFDWENDGVTDHVGIVESVEGGYVYTVEGNSGNRCRQNHYRLGDYQIYGYGVPAY